MSNSLIRNFFKKFHLTLLKNINIKGGSEICSSNKKFLLYATVLIILVAGFKFFKSNFIESFKTFSSTQNLGIEYRNILNNGLTDEVKRIINLIPLINYPNVENTKKEIEIIVNYQKIKNKNIIVKQGKEELNFDKEFSDLKLTNLEAERLEYFISNILDPIIFYFKIHYDRVRPSHFSDKVKPWLEVPNHPSYPSGHATQSFAIAYLLSKKYPHKENIYLKSAKRISINREIMGLHYESDTIYGNLIAKTIVKHSNFIP